MSAVSSFKCYLHSDISKFQSVLSLAHNSFQKALTFFLFLYRPSFSQNVSVHTPKCTKTYAYFAYAYINGRKTSYKTLENRLEVALVVPRFVFAQVFFFSDRARESVCRLASFIRILNLKYPKYRLRPGHKADRNSVKLTRMTTNLFSQV